MSRTVPWHRRRQYSPVHPAEGVVRMLWNKQCLLSKRTDLLLAMSLNPLSGSRLVGFEMLQKVNRRFPLMLISTWMLVQI